MRAALPPGADTRLIGREAERTQVETLLTSGRPTILVTGGVGVGKTAFVRTVVSSMIERDQVDLLSWFDQPPSVERIRLALRQIAHAALDSQGALDLRRYLGERTRAAVIVIDGMAALRQDTAALLTLLMEISSACVFLIDHQYIHALTPVIDAHIALAPLKDADAFALAHLFWQCYQREGDPETLDFTKIVAHGAGNPRALRSLISGYSFMLDTALLNNSIQTIFRETRQLLSPAAFKLWALMAMLPASGVSIHVLEALWHDHVEASAMNELLAHHLVQRDPQEEAYHLVDHAREWIQQAYRSEETTFALINELTAALDRAVESSSIDAVATVEQILMLPWIVLQHNRRQKWIVSSWRKGVQRNAWAVWLQLLREATADDHENADLWLGRGVCARWLGEWQECAESFRQAIMAASNQARWLLLAEVRLERSIFLRLRGQFEQAAKEQEIVIDLAKRYRDDALAERARCERAQIELERDDGESALAWLHDVEESGRGLLLRAEAYLLLRDFRRSKQQIEAALALLGDDQVGRAKAHALYGRLLYHDGAWEAARSQFDTAIILLQPADDEYGLSRVYGNLAALLTDMPEPDYQEAFDLLDQCEAIQRRLSDRVALAVTRHNREYLVSRLRADD